MCSNASTAWTGNELLVVGGSNGPGIKQIGAAYSPADDSWRPLPDPPGPVDAWENAISGQAVWTGSEMLIYPEGLAFDPATSSWRNVASPPGPPRATEVAVWTGRELIVWGGCDATEPQCDDLVTGLLTDGLIYEPAADRWRRMAMSPLSAGVHPQGVWSGEEMLIYAGGVAAENGMTAAAYDRPTTRGARSLIRDSSRDGTGQQLGLESSLSCGADRESGQAEGSSTTTVLPTTPRPTPG